MNFSIAECCMKCGAQEHLSRLHIFKAFPWVGIYLYALAYNNRKCEKYVYGAFFCMIFLFYFVYLASSYLWSFFLFRKSIPNGIDENFYGFVACMEFFSILFIRTRSTFKFVPLFLNIVFFFYLYYIKNTIYGYFYLGLYFVLCLSLTFFLLNLLFFEIPALSWNPSFHFVPSFDKPRMLFFPLFSLSSYYDLPHLWSMFYPLHDRSFFTNDQMALVDRNFVLLNSTLENARNNPINNNNQLDNNFDVEMQNFLFQPVPNPVNNNPIQNSDIIPLNNEQQQNLIMEEENSIHQNLLRNTLQSLEVAGPLENVNQRNSTENQANKPEYNRIE